MPLCVCVFLCVLLVVQAAAGAVFIDADLFFAMLFGSERFRPYLGTLFMASAIGESACLLCFCGAFCHSVH